MILLQSAVCTPFPANFPGAIECAGLNTLWFADPNIMGLILIVFVSYLGYRFGIPKELMYTFSMIFLVMLFFTFDILFMRALVVAGLIYFGILLGISYFKGGAQSS